MIVPAGALMLPALVLMLPVVATDAAVAAPVTATEARVVAPVTPRVDDSVVAPVTPRVPATAVLPLALATVSLLVATLKSPLVLTAWVESWSAESVPEPSLIAFRDEVIVAESVVLSRPV